jgi:hypothetical protein
MYPANLRFQVITPQLARLSDRSLSANAWAAKKCTVEQHEADRARMITATKERILKADPESGRHGVPP